MTDGGRRGASVGWRRSPDAAERATLARDSVQPVGLCLDCHHLRLLDSGRTRFVRCWLAESDAGYPRYPALPVVECAGHRPWREDR